MKNGLLVLVILSLGGAASAQVLGGAHEDVQNGSDDTSTVSGDTTNFSAPSNQTDSDQPLEQAPNGNLTGNTGLNSYEPVPGRGVSGSQSGSSSALPDLGAPSPSTPSNAEGPSPNTGPTLPEMAPGEPPSPSQNPNPNP